MFPKFFSYFENLGCVNMLNSKGNSMKKFYLFIFIIFLLTGNLWSNANCPTFKDEASCKQNSCQWNQTQCTSATVSEKKEESGGMFDSILKMFGMGKKEETPNTTGDAPKKDDPNDLTNKAKDMMAKKEKKPNCIVIPANLCVATKGCVLFEDKCLASEDVKNFGKKKK